MIRVPPPLRHATSPFLATIVLDSGDRQVNLGYMRYALTAEGLKAAMQFPCGTTRTDKILIFDGAIGRMNLSLSPAEFLSKQAPEAIHRVDKELMHKLARTAER